MASLHSRKKRYHAFEILDIAQFQSRVVKTQPKGLSGVPEVQAPNIEHFLLNRNRKCKSILVERDYIDRTFIDEYKEFYSTSFKPYKAACERLHFFTVKPRHLKKVLNELDLSLIGKSGIEYHQACREFSEKYYLGFMVVKRLPATRIGRTVIRHPKHDRNQHLQKGFPCTRIYTTHLLGLELSVCGLPFQQQDGGMSACASTALWASMSQYGEFERFNIPSPAALTKFASGHASEFGRLVPQSKRGLTVAQMCKAMEAASLTPLVQNFTGSKPYQVRSYIYAAVRSGFAPILLLERPGEAHAVAVSGMELAGRPTSTPKVPVKLLEESTRLKGLYVNDDRIGPYARATFNRNKITIETYLGPDNPWQITHMIVPLHSKIRFAFSDLYTLATNIATAMGFYAIIKRNESGGPQKSVQMRYWISKSRIYKQQTLFQQEPLATQVARAAFQNEHTFPRYVGVIRFSDSSIGTIDVVVDLTNTERHTNVWSIIGRNNLTPWGQYLVGHLGKYLGARTLCDIE